MLPRPTTTRPDSRPAAFLRPAALLILSVFLFACSGSNNSESDDQDLDRDGDGAPASADCDDSDRLVQSVKAFHVDADGDGFGGAITEELCALFPPPGYGILVGDCDDSDPDVSVEIPYYIDIDGDGFGARFGSLYCPSTAPPGFSTNSNDPNDANAAAVPLDRDGDGNPNADDCAPDDAAAYALETYFDDVDGDGLGGPPADFCVSLPAPNLPGYVSNAIDSCPTIPNTGRDLDDDGTDDACDAEIHIVGSWVTITEDVQFPHAIAATGEVIAYRIGSEADPTKVEFRGANLDVEDCVTVSLEGGSAIEMWTDTWDEPAVLSLGTTEGSPSGCETTIRGAHELTNRPLYRNQVRFRGARLDAGRRAAFRHLSHVSFGPADIHNDEGVLDEYGADLRNDPAMADDWALEEYLTVANAESGGISIQDQYLDLRKVRFVDNAGYPISCVHRDYRRLAGTSTRGERHRRGACQLAIVMSYFEGNAREGPVLRTFDRYDSDLDFPNTYDPDPALKPTAEYGTRTLYVADIDLRNRTEQNQVTLFKGVELLPMRSRPPSLSGEPLPEEVISFRARIEIAGTVPETATARFESSELSDIPILLRENGGRVEATDSTLGPILIDTLFASPFGRGGTVDIADSTLDFAGSPFEAVVRHIQPFGVVSAGIAFVSRDFVNPGSLTIRRSTIVSDDTIDFPIAYVSALDATGRIDIDDATTLEGTTEEDLIRIEEVGGRPGIEGFLELK
ncbi:MAG: hypothetical protein GY946_24045 [bacterium]|nr:hypothetical protein [bacterium]